MTSMDAESVATILCTAKQTRFNIATPSYRELDIEGLNITVKSSPRTPSSIDGKKKVSSRAAKAETSSVEILSNAKLRLKAGQRYALVGRNGTGKSTLLRAIAEKLIPGIPEETRVVLLQQTAKTGGSGAGAGGGEEARQSMNVLEEVIERATSREKVQREIQLLSQAVDSPSPFGALKGLRKLKYDRLQQELFLKDKDARLRSGARGLQARKALKEMEKKVQEFRTTQFEQPDDEISPDTLAQETGEAADMLADLHLQVEPSRMAQVESRAKQILAGLGFTDATIQKPVSSLSGGWRMRTALATALLQDDTDMLILDEPTNFLDMLGIMWLQRYLIGLAEESSSTGSNDSSTPSSSPPPTLILVSHDRAFISLCTDLLIIRDKEITYFHGSLPTYEASRAEKKLHLTRMKDAQERQKEHMQATIQRNMREGKAKDDANKIRQAKSRQKKLDDRMGLEVSSKGTRFKLNRDLVGYHLTSRAEIDIPQDDKTVRFVLPDPPELRFPGSLLSLENVSFRYPSATRAAAAAAKSSTPLVLQEINMTVQMGDRIGILGLNGSGKSTLIKLLVQQAKPTTGNFTAHPRLRMGYYSQHAVDDLLALASNFARQPQQQQQPGELTALRLLMLDHTTSSALDEGAIRSLLGTLGLPGRIASDVPLRKLSGGQLVHLGMARILARSPQLLVLDEVTTHLDYETVTAMRDALRSWPGAVVLVSHDRWFMRGVIEGILGDGAGGGGGDSGEDESDEDDPSGDAVPRRRLLYRLRAGKLSFLSGGVQEFEDSMEKRVRKLMNG
ncbi:ABC transporter [Microdochium trichocladiopsis]|uniref:ABC transporter n=1 Tax=Microdochium trichocladiopsis TaxID=1682393 RepID=A0A9P8Y6C0_9PEZI|nr:ABC transporter [Microdochium trichocladiopsis]KAH7031136.1 ABC transporter [Microdochium trichocladiopsis]